MTDNTALRRAQVYRFLAEAFLYPSDAWPDDAELAGRAAGDLQPAPARELSLGTWELAALQAEHRRCFGLVGSQCYETEFGLPHEYRQSQELADLAGFYRAFGFQIGGPVRERPDHLAVELEFLHVLALKEAVARERGTPEQVEVCREAQRKFLQDHLGEWIEPFAESVGLSAGTGPYVRLAQYTAAWVMADARRLGAEPRPRRLRDAQPTPPPPALTCDGCALAE